MGQEVENRQILLHWACAGCGVLWVNIFTPLAFGYTRFVLPNLADYQAILLDLDGTLYHDEHSLPGAVELLLHLSQRRLAFACLSNSTSSPLRVMQRLERMGVAVDPDHIYTAAAAAADYVLENYGPQPRIFNLSTEGIHELLDQKVQWVATDAEPCHAMIVGTPTNVYATEERRRTALMLARHGAAIVGICADRVYPSIRGLEFGAGAHSWMIAYASGGTPIFVGKPKKIFFHNLCKRLNVQPERCLLIGDNLESDILGAKAVSMKTVLTLTGVTRRRDLLGAKPQWQPDFIVEDLSELLSAGG